MSDSNVQKKIGRTPDHEEQLAKLRSLLISPEQDEIAKIKERLDVNELRAEEVSRVLAEAIIIRARRDDRLALALLPTIEEVIRNSVKKDPKFLADAIFPIIGPAIRKSIAEAIRSMMQSFNEILRHTASWQGIKWRIESLQTGKSFAEIVMLHTLIYQVEQVFLIHRETGLVLLHVASNPEDVQDVDMVSGMLTAIQDFAKDSFGVKEGQALQNLNIGELTVWIEQGSEAVLAAVIQGNPPLELRSAFQEALENIEFEQSQALQSFKGDAAPFEPSRYRLAACLVKAQHDEKEQRAKPIKKHTEETKAEKEKKGGPSLIWLIVGAGILCLIIILAAILIQQMA